MDGTCVYVCYSVNKEQIKGLEACMHMCIEGMAVSPYCVCWVKVSYLRPSIHTLSCFSISFICIYPSQDNPIN